MDDVTVRARPTGMETFRWFVAGLIFLFLNTVVLYMFVRLFRMHVAIATLLSAEICTLLRFVLNELWVFGSPQFGWKRLWQYHIANGGAFGIWWLATNLLASYGVNYIVASIGAVLFSTGFSFLSNFYWIWRKKHPQSQA